MELASQGDSIYDFVDKDDHEQVRTQLDSPPHNDRGEAKRLSFFCRMSTSRYMKTQMRSWKNKVSFMKTFVFENRRRTRKKRI